MTPIALPLPSSTRASRQSVGGTPPPVRVLSAVLQSPLGPVLASAVDRGIVRVWFADEDQAAAQESSNECSASRGHLDALKREIDAYFAGRLREFTVPLAPRGTPFQQQVWDRLVAIPYGQTRSYSDIAGEVDNPLAVRAVGAANGANPIAILIPCHRVVAADGSLWGYGGGLWRKQALLDLERVGAPLFDQSSIGE